MLVRSRRNSRRSFMQRLCAPLLLPSVNAKIWASLLAGTAGDPSDQARAAASNSAYFRDVAPEAGIKAELTCGSREKNWILEVYGSGCVWFDYNNDGYVDLYIVNGSTIENLLHPSLVKHPPHNYL